MAELSDEAIRLGMIVEFSKLMPVLRKLVNVSQATLGKKIGVSRQYVSAVERGDISMAWATYVAAVKFFLVNCKGDILELVYKHWTYVDSTMAENADSVIHIED